MKIRGYFKIIDPATGKVLARAENDLLGKGARFLTSFVANRMVADGYGAAAVYVTRIHYGTGSTPVDKTNNFRMESYVGSIAITATARTSDTLVTISGTITGAVGGTFISELGLGLTAANPANSADYANAVVDRAVLPSTIVISEAATRTITYNFEMIL